MRIAQNVAIAMMLLLVGCDVDWPQAASTCGVTGQLTLNGEAIAEAKVVFVPQRGREDGVDRRIASGLTNAHGEFILEIDSRQPRQIQHGRYRVIVSKITDGVELFEESFNKDSVLMVDVNSQEAIQRPTLNLSSPGTL